MLNPHSPLPLYRQLADILMAKIRAGEYPPGTRIPSENRLAAQYRIGRPTARQATDWLVRKRVLLRKRGSGTYVRTHPREIDLFSLAGTTSAFQKEGICVATEILEKTRLAEVAVDSENPFAGKTAFFLSRLSRVDGVPVLLEDIYLDRELFHTIDQMDVEGRSLSQIVDEHYYMRPTGGKQSFRIIHTNGREAQALEVSSKTPILLVKRFLHFQRAEDAIYSELLCRTDQFVFSQRLGGTAEE